MEALVLAGAAFAFICIFPALRHDAELPISHTGKDPR